MQVAMGEYAPEQRLPSVREVALATGVNPNTVQKSFETLEAKGIIYSVRGSGWYVGRDDTPAKNVLEDLRRRKTELYLAEMERLGCERDDIIRRIKEERVNE